MAETLVFVPAWNEERNLPSVLAELRSALPDAHVLVVDDGSTDGTAAVATSAGADVLSFSENRGLRAAVARGYTEAAERGYAYCARIDADGSILRTSFAACSSECVPAIATLPSGRASSPATGTPSTDTGRAPTARSGPPCSAA